jgi:RNA polymerase-binding transcription factor DksA
VFPAATHRPIDPDDFDALDRLDEPEFLAQQRTLLVAERSTYSVQAEMLRAEADELAAEMEPGDVQFDDESGEGATTSIERERDLAMSAAALATVEDIDRALVRLEAGVYGVCLSCGELVARARLRALPHVGLCIQCKSGGLSRR